MGSRVPDEALPVAGQRRNFVVHPSGHAVVPEGRRRLLPAGGIGSAGAPKLDVNYINPLIQSVIAVFSLVLNMPVTRGAAGVSRLEGEPAAMEGQIGMSGAIRGRVSMVFPKETAVALLGRWFGAAPDLSSQEARDGVAELVHIVAGRAKAQFFDDLGSRIDLGLPSAALRSEHAACAPGALWLVIPFESALGTFSLRVSIQRDEAHLG